MPSEDKVKAAEVWNESSLKLQQMINDQSEQQEQVSDDDTQETTKSGTFTFCNTAALLGK